MTKLQKYEEAKKELQSKNLTSEEYLKAIRDLTRRLKL